MLITEMNTEFVRTDVEDIEEEAFEFQHDHKVILSNFVGLSEEYDCDMLTANKTLLIRRREFDFYRLYILTDDIIEATVMLKNLDDCEYVLNVPTKGTIDVWYELMRLSGFELIATYSRYYNTRIATERKHPTDLNILAKESDVRDIQALLLRHFSKYTDHLPTDKELLDLIVKKQVYVDRTSDNIVCGVDIFKLEGKSAYGYLWAEEGDRAIDLHYDVYNSLIDKGVNYYYYWINDSNKGVIKMHKRMGAVPDGTRDYTFIKK